LCLPPLAGGAPHPTPPFALPDVSTQRPGHPPPPVSPIQRGPGQPRGREASTQAYDFALSFGAFELADIGELAGIFFNFGAPEPAQLPVTFSF